MAETPIPVPQSIVAAVERFVDDEMEGAKKFSNRTPLDQSGVFDLHTLVAKAYAEGWGDGARCQREREYGARRRAEEATAS